MQKIILFTFIFSFSLCNDSIINTSLLFCLNKNSNNLLINKLESIETNYPQLNTIIKSHNITDLKRWLPSATQDDYDGDIYLDKIYKISFNVKSKEALSILKKELEQLDIIYSSEFEYIRKPLYTPNDQYYSQQWYLPAINSNDVWNLWTNQGNVPGNENVLLASVDLGVNYSHQDLKNNIWQNLNEDADGDGRTIEGSGSNWYLDPGDLNGIDDDDWDNNPNTYIDDLVGWDCSGMNGVDDNDPDPPHTNSWSHGTHVAGLLASTTDNNIGIASTAFNCSIMSVKVSDENQSGQIYITDGFAGVLYAAKAGYYSGFTIINNSWGGIGYNQYEQATINVCFNDYNAIIVCAGGNGNWGEAYEIQYPSGYDNVVAVAPLGTNNQWNHWGTYHETIDLSSPGENIRSTTNNGYASWDGSSMASPIAASVFGLLKSYQPNWNNEMIQTMVLGTADPIIYTVNSESYLEGRLGTGRVDSYYAITTPLFPDIQYVGEDIVSGDDDIISAGEQAEIFILLFNNPGWGNAINVNANLYSDNTEVSIINNNINYGDIPIGEAMIVEPFLIDFSSSIPTSDIEFVLTITSNEYDHVQYKKEILITYHVEEMSNLFLGDINGDEELSVLDIVLLINIVLGNSIPTEYETQASDLNQDGIINILDIISLLNLIISMG